MISGASKEAPKVAGDRWLHHLPTDVAPGGSSWAPSPARGIIDKSSTQRAKESISGFIDGGLVRFEHHPFPLDLAALNAEIILRCDVDNIKKFELLSKIYEKQRVWAVGSDINKINDSIKKIGSELNLENNKMNDCLGNDKKQDEILNQRIEAQKKYKIESTPTILINEKKYSGEIEYFEFKKAIEKNL